MAATTPRPTRALQSPKAVISQLRLKHTRQFSKDSTAWGVNVASEKSTAPTPWISVSGKSMIRLNRENIHRPKTFKAAMPLNRWPELSVALEIDDPDHLEMLLQQRKAEINAKIAKAMHRCIDLFFFFATLYKTEQDIAR